MVCPDLTKCELPISRVFFKRFCNAKGRAHEGCNHYCKRHGSLKPAIQWLQKIAVEQGMKVEGI